jgi:hypothetical protein
MTLANSDHLRFAVGCNTIVRSPRPWAPIGKGLLDRCERAPPELVESATPDLVLHGHISYSLSPEQGQDSLHTLFLLGLVKPGHHRLLLR